MNRLPDWEQRLSAYLAPLLNGVTYRYGTMDCALFSAGAVLAMTGVDLAADFRGRYTTATGSTRALKRYGAGDLRATIDTMLPERPVAYARRGDLVMDECAVGVCIGGAALFVGEHNGSDGIYRVDRSEWTCAWSVGA
ncbi:hypothetical protein I5E68_07035 [Novosphingobium sp. YJ-S2-02]|uniref:DUF6950 domain-containing protein n=1 Tax=Novosphingobium aureum TaxID=2792964 RepID=A0A931MKQ4_9SPHN|nr:hypothetical protein [Novosphingobium aureum]MBH0112704.1 hypothetical protein [Novosphingobium aureum]